MRQLTPPYDLPPHPPPPFQLGLWTRPTASYPCSKHLPVSPGVSQAEAANPTLLFLASFGNLEMKKVTTIYHPYNPKALHWRLLF